MDNRFDDRDSHWYDDNDLVPWIVLSFPHRRCIFHTPGFKEFIIHAIFMSIRGEKPSPEHKEVLPQRRRCVFIVEGNRVDFVRTDKTDNSEVLAEWYRGYPQTKPRTGEVVALRLSERQEQLIESLYHAALAAEEGAQVDNGSELNEVFAAAYKAGRRMG